MQGAGTSLMRLGNVECNNAAAAKVQKNKAGIERVAAFASFTLCLLYLLAVLLPVSALLAYSGAAGFKAMSADRGIITSVKVSLSTTSIALLLTVCLGTPVAFFINNCRIKVLSKILEVLTSLPIVIPPAVAGLSLLLVFGRSSIIGAFLNSIGAGIIFTPFAVILAQFFVSSGFYIQVLGAGIGTVEKELLEISYIMGAGRIETFLKVVLPIIKKPAIAGLALTWTRSMGEFGATIILSGNIEGVTRTMPLEIYTLMQTDITKAAVASMLLLVISFLALLAIKVWTKE